MLGRLHYLCTYCRTLAASESCASKGGGGTQPQVGQNSIEGDELQNCRHLPCTALSGCSFRVEARDPTKPIGCVTDSWATAGQHLYATEAYASFASSHAAHAATCPHLHHSINCTKVEAKGESIRQHECLQFAGIEAPQHLRSCRRGQAGMQATQV